MRRRYWSCTVTELAAHLRVSFKTVYRLLEDLGIKTRRGALDEHQVRSVMLLKFLNDGHRAMPGHASRLRMAMHKRTLKRQLERDLERRKNLRLARPASKLPGPRD